MELNQTWKHGVFPVTVSILFFISSGVQPAVAIEKIGVVKFTNRSGFSGSWNIAKGMTELVRRALEQTHQYKLVPEDELAQMARKHRLRLAQLVNTSTRMVDIGKCLGIKALVGGEIKKFDISATGGQTSLLWPWKGSYVYYAAEVRVDLKILKPLQLVVKPIVGEDKENKFKVIFPEQPTDDLYKLDQMEFGSEEFAQTTIGKAVNKVIQEIVVKISYEVPATRGLLEAQVLRVIKDDVYINLGEWDGVKVGDKFWVYNKGEALKDPKTGLVLGYTDKKVGNIQIVEIKGERVSKAKIIEGKGKIEELDNIKQIPEEIPSE